MGVFYRLTSDSIAHSVILKLQLSTKNKCTKKNIVTPIRGVPNPNNSDESEFIGKRIVPFLINHIEIMNIRIWLLISRIGVCSIRAIPIRNRIHSVNIPYEPNNNRIFQI